MTRVFFDVRRWYAVKIEVAPDGALLIAGLLLSESRGLSAVIMICAAVHELGHLIAAFFMGVRLKRLRLGLFGARIYPEGVMSYREEFIICACGPAFNFLLAFVVLVGIVLGCGGDMSRMMLGASGAVYAIRAGVMMWADVPYIIICISVIQAFTNLVPIEGLDGGRMMSSVISRYGNVELSRASESAVTVSAAICLWVVSVYILLKTGSGIGIFIAAVSIFAKKLIKK